MIVKISVIEILEPSKKRTKYNDHYMGYLNLPIYESGKKRGIETKSLLNDLLSKDKSSPQVCQGMPLGVHQSLVFLLNLEKFSSEKDILCDGNGIWAQTSTKVKY